jgi:hypothetical protein
MAQPSRKFGTVALTILAIAGLVSGTFIPLSNLTNAQAATQKAGTTQPSANGPFIGPPVYPTVFNGDLRDLVPDQPTGGGELPAPGTIKQPDQGGIAGSTGWVDPVAQQSLSRGQMPGPITSFEGLNIADGGGWHPPDTNGDVGPNHYIQTVNIAIGIYDKATGQELVNLPFNTFFQGPIGTPCDNENRGDVVVLYDALVQRWLVTDFALPATGPDYQCFAVSQSEDPVSGGWYFYAMPANFGTSWQDYPKFGVWADGWYMSANMFDPWIGARVWALDRASMITGGALIPQAFNAGSAFGSLLPANLRGALPPTEGTPEYFASVDFPNKLNLWQFHVDWDTPANSTFTQIASLTVADFQLIWDIPQLGTGQLLDSLGDRLMMQLQYRNLNGVEALYVNHTVDTGGLAGIRWYEIRDPGGIPVVFQQSTYQPDDKYRWMGSIAADGEGNIAVGYSVSSTTMYPSIRYAGRLAGETPNLLTQNEASLIEGTGSQVGSNRWGDYSAMTVDPVDDCTFWYTQEYFTVTSGNWQTRIGSFKFPSCGQPKGTVSGYVRNSVTNQPIAGVPLFVQGAEYNFSTTTDGAGYYSIDLIEGSYDMTAGPFLPGYPGTDLVNSVSVTVGNTTSQDFFLDPTPSLVDAGAILNDGVLFGNGNGFAEPGEYGLELFEALFNQGAITSTQLTAKLTSLTSGVTVDIADSSYPDIAAGDTVSNTTPYIFSIDPSIPCGTDLNFMAVVTDSVNTYNTTMSLNASIPMPREDYFFNDVEGGNMGWTTGGTPNTWVITTEDSHSSTHSWTDSQGGAYPNNANNWVRTPALNLSGLRHVQLNAWIKYALESGYDTLNVEYSLNGGTTWNGLALFTGTADWNLVTIDAAALDNQSNAALRFRLNSDVGVIDDGVHLDDIALSYEPFVCTYTPAAPEAPTLVSPADGSSLSSPVTFVWQPAATGIPADGFIFYLDDSPVMTFTSPVTSTILEPVAGPHTWFVKATNPFGTSPQSETWDFTRIAIPPASFGKTAPADGTDGVSTNPTMSWESSAGSLSYSYCIDTISGDTCEGTWTSTVTNTSVLLDGLLNGTTYYWQVQALNADGETFANEGTWWSFNTIVNPPGNFGKTDPANGAGGLPTNPMLSWESSSGATSYEYCVDDTDDNTCDGAWTDTGTDTSTGLSGLANGATYYWQVRALNAGGETEANDGTWWTFTVIISPPVDFGKIGPADGAVTSAANPTLSWESSSGATSYEYCVDYTDDNTCDGAWTGTGTNTSVDLVGLTTGSPYYWQVRAINP